jgi:hypothetical protein
MRGGGRRLPRRGASVILRAAPATGADWRGRGESRAKDAADWNPTGTP